MRASGVGRTVVASSLAMGQRALMHFVEYTPENICKALGLPAFVPEVEEGWAARILLKPSFHVEVCITFVVTGDVSRVEIRVPSKQVGLQWLHHRVPVFTVVRNVAQHVASSVLEAFRA